MICLTFDSDYMSPEDMARFLEEFPLPGKGTFFLHRPFGIDFLGHELGPHPVFDWDQDWETQLTELQEQLELSPAGIRTHSLAYTQPFAGLLARMGFRYMSMTTPLHQDGIRPYRDAFGNWEMPIFYMDNLDIYMEKNWRDLNHHVFDPGLIERAVKGPGLYVFDFHPLHIILNTRRHGDYLKVREEIAVKGNSAFGFEAPGRGTREFFLDLCRAMEETGVESLCLDEALTRHIREIGQTV